MAKPKPKFPQEILVTKEPADGEEYLSAHETMDELNAESDAGQPVAVYVLKEVRTFRVETSLE